MNDAVILLTGAQGQRRTASLVTYLDAGAEEQALADAYQWIKSLRRLDVDGHSMRERFSVRGDSLWWFTELYLHKLQVVLTIHRVLAALRQAVARERPQAIAVERGTILVRHLVAGFADASGLPFTGRRPRAIDWTLRLARLDARARVLNGAALISRTRLSRVLPSPNQPTVAAFVHRAFWREDGGDGSAESYIGPVLQALEQQGARVRYIGIGPTENFRARRWWDPVLGGPGRSPAVPIERFAPLSALAASREVWRARYANFRTLTGSPAIRDAAMIQGVDTWNLLKEQLAGVAWLQWPWSVRAMDEAAAALDALRPETVLTYAEAGGWGRALVLESRRRGIPSVGLQHGFIYRHWLNYLHEPDEMTAASDGDRGFPYPTRTLLFDAYTARHLRENGRFPADALGITGSPQRDALIRAVKGATAADCQQTRARIGVSPDDVIVLLTTKEREARAVLPALIAAADTIRGARLVIKPHPAETVEAYRKHAVRGQVIILEPRFPLPALLATCRALVTVNSTVALDAAVSGVPALVIGLPNNLTPLVDAGLLAGASSAEAIAPTLERILYDEGFRQQLANRQSAFLEVESTARAGNASARSAAAILDLAERQPKRYS